MTGSIIVRQPRADDFAVLSRMDLRYDASRVLRITRSGAGAALTFSLEWASGTPGGVAVYNEYSEARLASAAERVDLFVVAEIDRRAAGLLMIMLPAWTDAGEITDLAIDGAYRRRGAGRALLESAVAFARERSLRALWVEPRTDNAPAIEFYLSSGFRISGFSDRMYSNRDDDDGRTTLLMHFEIER